MPKTSRTFVQASIVYLCLGAILGALLFINRWLPLEPRIAALKSSHVQLLVVGWLTQLILGVDRDSAQLADLFDEQNEAVRRAIRDLIQTAHESDRKVGLCGQAPSDHPEFATFLVKAGIDSISLNPDGVLQVIREIAPGMA